jgi:hypothetical protein
MINLWPEITEVSEVTPPVTILDQQALMLGNMTKNILLAEVKTEERESHEFSYGLYIIAPVLDNYRYRLLTVWHNIDLYPVIVMVEKDIHNEIHRNFEDKQVFSPWAMKEWELPGWAQSEDQAPDSFQVDSESEFLDILKAILGASKTKRIISALLAQSLPSDHKSLQEQR